jgi:hypothetical protein
MPVILEGTPYAYRNASPAPGIPDYAPGTLLLEENGGRAGTVYVVDYQSKLRWFKTGDQFLGLGFKWDDIIRVPESVLLAYGADADNKNVRVISDSDPLLLVAPAVKPSNGNTKKYLIAGVVVVLAIIVFLKLRKTIKG